MDYMNKTCDMWYNSTRNYWDSVTNEAPKLYAKTNDITNNYMVAIGEVGL